MSQHLDPDEILRIGTEIKESTLYPLSYKRDYFAQRYPQFAESYPALLTMSCTPQFDLSQLKFMVQRLKSVQANNTTVHDASVAVGQKLVNTYVKPQLADAEPKKIKR
jgi:hypothetical protein